MTPSRTADDGPSEVSLVLNGAQVQLTTQPHWTLLRLLREEAGLTGTKHGCNRGQCGACTVLVDGATRYACLTLSVLCDGAAVTTVEGLASSRGDLHPVQVAFIEEHGFQCGFCTPGFLLSAVQLLNEKRHGEELSEETLRSALAGHVCRCGNYVNIERAVRRAWDEAHP